jgi:hypothetical protein
MNLDFGLIGEETGVGDHARTVLRFFESWGKEGHRLGNCLVSGLQLTHSLLTFPAAATGSPLVPKVTGLVILLGKVVTEIRHFHELKETDLLPLLSRLERKARKFPNTNRSRFFGRDVGRELEEELHEAEETLHKISSLLQAPFNMAGGLEPDLKVQPSLDPTSLFPPQLGEGAADDLSQPWILSVQSSGSKLTLQNEKTAQSCLYADLSTRKQVRAHWHFC